MDLISFIQSLSYTAPTTAEPEPETPSVDLVLGDSVVTMTGTETESGGTTGHFLWSPRGLWHEGKTYFAYPKVYNTEGLGQLYIFVYDEKDGLKRPYRLGNTQILNPDFGVPDGHIVPSFQIDNDGNLFVFQERTHDSPIDIYKGSSFNNFELLAEKINPGTGATAQSSYHNIMKLPNGNGWSWCRMTKLYEAYSGGHGASVSASNGFESWGSLVRNTTNPRPVMSSPGSGTDKTRHYPVLPYYRQIISIDGADHVVCIRVQRTDNYVTGLGSWNQYYIHASPVGANLGVVFKNLIGTPYTHDISGANYMTETILNDKFLIYSSGAETNNALKPIATCSLHPKIFMVTGDAHTGNLLLHIIDIPTRALTTKTLNITGYHIYDPDASQEIAVKHIAYIESGGYLEIAIEIDYPSDVIKGHLFRTYDLGDTFIDRGDMFPEIATSTRHPNFPFNYLDIPDDRNFIITAIDVEGVPTAKTTYFKRAAKGALQVETPNIVIPAASFSDANDFFDYLAVDGQISRSGNNVTGLTDQFGLRNATGVNNPQWDGSDTITLTHTSSHHFTIPTTGFSGLTKCTFFAVVKRTVSTGAGDYGILLISNSGATSDYVGWFANDGGAGDTPSLRFVNASSGVALTDHGQYVPALDEWVLIDWSTDGRCKTDIHVNGQKQFYQTTNYSTLTHFQKRGRLDYGTINSVNIGFLNRSASDVYFPFAFKRLMMKNNVYDYETLRALRKKIADAHGITLNYGYQ